MYYVKCSLAIIHVVVTRERERERGRGLVSFGFYQSKSKKRGRKTAVHMSRTTERKPHFGSATTIISSHGNTTTSCYGHQQTMLNVSVTTRPCSRGRAPAALPEHGMQAHPDSRGQLYRGSACSRCDITPTPTMAAVAPVTGLLAVGAQPAAAAVSHGMYDTTGSSIYQCQYSIIDWFASAVYIYTVCRSWQKAKVGSTTTTNWHWVDCSICTTSPNHHHHQRPS